MGEEQCDPNKEALDIPTFRLRCAGGVDAARNFRRRKVKAPAKESVQNIRASSEYATEKKNISHFPLIPSKPTANDWKKAESDAIFKHICMLNQYSDDVNPQMHAIIASVMEVCEDDEVPLSILSKVLDSIDSEYKQFHGLTPVCEGSENWAKQKSVRLLYGDVKIDRVSKACTAARARHH
jgi:hypothetical protein